MNDFLVPFLSIVFLLTTNAFFVAAEFALVKLRHGRASALAEGGSNSARMTLHIKENLEPYLAACQLGITMASLGLGWVGEPFVAALLEPTFRALGLDEATLHTTAFITGFAFFSSLHIVIGEQVPKTLAIRKPEKVSLLTAWLLHAFFLLAWPLNAALNFASRTLLRWMGIQEASHEEVFSGEELSELVDTSRDHGQLAPANADMIKNLFAFDRRTVRDVMTPRGQVHMVRLEDPPEKVRKMVLDTGHSRFPVVSGNAEDFFGLLLTKDLFAASLAGDGDATGAIDELVRPAFVVPDNIGIGQLFESMKNRRSHMALVVDEFGAFSGIVTLEDLLEEIVGEIDDELDEASAAAVLTETPGGWQVDGLAALHEIDRALGTVLHESPNASSLSGLLMTRLGRMPAVGDEVEEAGFRFRIQSMVGRRVGTVEIARIAAEAPPPAAPPPSAEATGTEEPKTDNA